jgi:hypothetical protein
MQNPERDELTREDARFLERLRAHYTPEPLSGAERTAFDAKLRERIERSRWRGALLPAFGAASLAALAVWLVPVTQTPVVPVPAPAPVARVQTAEAPSSPAANWEQTLFYGDLTRDAVQDVSAELPPEYAAIEGVFFDGV